ncbi:MAG TPA: helix-turn-helix domain-containing protein [Solirubrobacteraceae bacterium]
MDRVFLERLLDQGLSLAQIAKRFDLHEATVGYWVKKHSSQAANREKHAARGAITRTDLEALLDAEMSIAQIAQAVGRSKATVRHWLRRHDLKTHAQQERLAGHSTRAMKAAGKATVMRRCSRHGVTAFWLEGRGYYRCKRCRMERVSQRRRKLKLILVGEAGGCCALCGYDRCVGALHFHHIDPASKQFHLSMHGATRALAAVRAEMAKCVLLCANCHAEVELGLVRLPLPDAAGRRVA